MRDVEASHVKTFIDSRHNNDPVRIFLKRSAGDKTLALSRAVFAVYQIKVYFVKGYDQGGSLCLTTFKSGQARLSIQVQIKNLPGKGGEETWEGLIVL
jgi:hypothetical protein